MTNECERVRRAALLYMVDARKELEHACRLVSDSRTGLADAQYAVALALDMLIHAQMHMLIGLDANETNKGGKK